jgi:hypothetical protein
MTRSRYESQLFRSFYPTTVSDRVYPLIVASNQRKFHPACCSHPFLAVYDRAYDARLAEILTVDFPAVQALLGNEEFDASAGAYIRNHSSKYRSVRWLGRLFADWVQTTPPYDELPVVADMAAFE